MLRKSFCRICTSMCGLMVDVEGDVIRKITGDVTDPLTEGYSCSKGRAAGELHHRNDRLLAPKMRKDGVLQTVGWDEALDDLAGKLRKIIDESGPDAVAIFLGGGCYLDSAAYATVRPMREALGTRSFYSDMSIDVMSKGVVGEMVGGMAAMPRPDMGRCKLVIYVGTNPMVSHGHTSMLNNPTKRLREFTDGGEVWVLDPRYTETAMKATRHERPRPDHRHAAHVQRAGGADQGGGGAGRATACGGLSGRTYCTIVQCCMTWRKERITVLNRRGRTERGAKLCPRPTSSTPSARPARSARSERAPCRTCTPSTWPRRS
jgi:predicted molibdopterin-dependent oxidoreductase YjgC